MSSTSADTTGDMTFFDGHIHYNASAWPALTPEQAVARLARAGIDRALVSSTPTEGTARLYALDSTRIVPLLRPYRSSADRRTWYDDPTLVARLERQLDELPYRGIGEFHVFGADASTPVMADVIALARDRGLFLQAHSDTDAIVRILEQTGEATTVIWAHAGFDVPLETLQDLLDRYPQLLLELSYRSDIAPDGELTPAWRDLFTAYPERFLVGMDTHHESRWEDLVALADEARQWLGQLPPGIAQQIARENPAALLERED
jgi:hypothetical protein